MSVIQLVPFVKVYTDIAFTLVSSALATVIFIQDKSFKDASSPYFIHWPFYFNIAFCRGIDSEWQTSKCDVARIIT